jgi:hypothetical protein
MDEPYRTVVDLDERPVRGDALDGPVYDRPDL